MLASNVATGRIVETFCGSFYRHKFPLNPVFLIISTSPYLSEYSLDFKCFLKYYLNFV